MKNNIISFLILVGVVSFSFFLLFPQNKKGEVEGTNIKDQNDSPVNNPYMTEATEDEFIMRDIGKLIGLKYTKIEQVNFYLDTSKEIVGSGLIINNISQDNVEKIINYLNSEGFSLQDKRYVKNDMVCVINSEKDIYEIRCGILHF